MRGKGLLVYSSKTGNTKKLAEAVHTSMMDDCDICSIDNMQGFDDVDWIILGFWVDRGTADRKCLDFIETLENRKVGLIGTLGAYPDSDHAGDVKRTVSSIVKEKNDYLGCFLCQGKVDPELTRRFESLPSDHPHAMNQARRERHKEAAKHPDEKDFEACRIYCREMLEKI